MNNQVNGSEAADKTWDVIIVGAGFAGIGAAIKLQEKGIEFLVLEKAQEVGGVWRENSYPDCACDIPSALYSYSFAPNPYWSRLFATQPDIQNYTLETVEKFGLRPLIQVSHELLESRWNSQNKQWELETSQGKFKANYVIMACGPMHKPVFPDIPGLESFSGESFHSAQWNHDCDLDGKKVAVIGSGASAIQFLPVIQRNVEQLTLFQRTPPWVLPKFDMPISEKWQQRFARFPLLQKSLRKLLYLQYEFLNSGLKRKGFIKRLQGVGLKNIYKSIKDSDLRERLVPNYDIGCKRILQSNKWYPTLACENVSVFSGVAAIQGNTLTDQNGNRCEADVIIFATGFEVANPPMAEIVYGSKGVSLAEQWQGSPEVYLGTMAKDCPNCFLTFGPNLYSFTSAFVIIEAQLDFIVDALTKARAKKLEMIAVNDEVCDEYNEGVQSALQRTVWNSGGCTSYFIDKNGRNSTNWPWTTFKLRRQLKRFNESSYNLE